MDKWVDWREVSEEAGAGDGMDLRSERKGRIMGDSCI